MQFHSIIFLIFLPICLLVYQQISKRYRSSWLLLCSYFFYAWWNIAYLGIIVFSTLVDFWCAKRMGHAKPYPKKLLLGLSLLTNLGLLIFFKYAGWLSAQFHLSGGSSIFENILLPVGISFYTFQTLSYTIDVYRGHQKAEKNLLQFALFVSFFPQLVAGPIERAQHMLPALKKNASINSVKLESGIALMLWGFFKKLVVADRMGAYADQYFNQLNPPEDAAWAVLASLCFGMQILFDFSAYTDIARGAARCLNIDLMENFKHPYGAKSFRSFWQRWHISLSTWFRDYFYISLGGNRKTEQRVLINLFLTFLISGVWHGANNTFLIWGALHGLYYITERAMNMKFQITVPLLSWLLVFGAVHLAWIFFRSRDVTFAWTTIEIIGSGLVSFSGDFFQSIVGGDSNQWKILLGFLTTLFFGGIAIMGDRERHHHQKGILTRIYSNNFVMIQVLLIISVLFFGAFGESTFIYFQF